MALLTLENVGKSFNGFVALNEVGFEVDNGEIFGIAGPNGAGKTTLFNVIAGMIKGTGDIRFNNLKIDGCKSNKVCHSGIGRTFQIPLLFSTLSIFENIKVGAHFGSEGKNNENKVIEEMLEYTGLTGKGNNIVGQLPLYEKKLTMLASVLATKPKLILMDEPLGGLSLLEVRACVELIKGIRKKLGITIIIIEHLMKALVEICDRLMILHNGEKICIGPPKTVANDKKVIEIYLGDRYA
jgi:branched-chain amino acid transport system ATP-binding protein